MIEGPLDADAGVAYEESPVAGLEQHLWVLEGAVEITVENSVHTVRKGDCLRFRLRGPSRFHCPGPGPVRYALLIVLPLKRTRTLPEPLRTPHPHLHRDRSVSGPELVTYAESWRPPGGDRERRGLGGVPGAARPRRGRRVVAGAGRRGRGGRPEGLARPGRGTGGGHHRPEPCPVPNARHRAEVAKLMVRPSTRGQGLGRSLLAAAEGAAAEAGVTLLVLDTETGSPAERLYRAAGWTECGSIPDYAGDPAGDLKPTTFYYKASGRRAVGFVPVRPGK